MAEWATPFVGRSALTLANGDRLEWKVNFWSTSCAWLPPGGGSDPVIVFRFNPFAFRLAGEVHLLHPVADEGLLVGFGLFLVAEARLWRLAA